MVEDTNEIDSFVEDEKKKLEVWIRLLRIVFRGLIVLGLALLIVAVVVVVIVPLFGLWIFAVPVALIALGIFLAWLEYRLNERVNTL